MIVDVENGAEYMDTIGARLRHVRLSHAWTQAELAAKSGVGVVTISRLENGRYGPPRPPTIRRLSQALGISPAWLMFGEDSSSKTTARLVRAVAG